MHKNESKLKKLYDAIMMWCDGGRPPIRGLTVADKDALWALGADLQRFHRAATFNGHAAQALKKFGFRVEETEVGWSIYDD